MRLSTLSKGTAIAALTTVALCVSTAHAGGCGPVYQVCASHGGGHAGHPNVWHVRSTAK